MPDFDPNEYLKKQSQSKGFDPNKYLEENTIEKKNSVQPVLPTGTQPSKRGFEPFLPQVPTKAPSVLLSNEQKQQREKERIGERFETTLLNVPTEFGKVGQFMRSAKKVKDTLPQVPTMKPDTGGMVVIPQGEKIGDSLRKGDTFQDVITDKFTNKKTALQKQIESAQEAFRTAQGEDVYGEIQDAQQLDYMSPERVEVERERKGNYVKFLYNQFLDGTGSAVSGIVDAALAIDRGMPMASPLSKSGLILDYYRKNYAKGVKNFLKDNIGAEVDKGLEAKYNEGMLTGAIGGLASSAPAMLTGGMTKGLSMVAQMYDGAIQSIESRPDADQWDNDTKTLFAGTLGLIQGQLEKYGLDKVLKGGELTNVIFKKILKSAEGKNITGNILENLIDESVKGVARVFAKGGVRAVDGFASEFYTGAGQEASAIGIESLFDKVTGKPIFDTSNKTNWIGFVDRIAKAGFQEGIGGFVLGGGVGMLSGASKKKIKEGQTVINEIDKQLDNPDTLPEVKEVLIQRKADSQANIDDIVDEEADKQSKMNSEDFAKSQELSKQVEKIDLALQDPNTGESVKAGLESQKKAIESEIDEILKNVPAIAKPTFDTEESLTEQIRAAEKEFNETGDSAEYQLKINDLNTRLENLVPAPEDAEIGKQRADRIAEIESILSNDDATFAETGSRPLLKEARVELKAELEKLRQEQGVKKEIKPKEDSNSALRDVDSTSKALEGKNTGLIEVQLLGVIAGNLVTGKSSEQTIAEEYHKAKVDGTNPELVKAVEDLLTPKPQEDAVQVETAGQVPVQPEAPVSEEVEQGKPEAEPKVVTEEGVKAEEVVSGAREDLKKPAIEVKNNAKDSVKGTKVSDENEEPIVVYHGTQRKFDTFELPSYFGNARYSTQGGAEMGMRGKGIFFSSNKDAAKSYSVLDKRKKSYVMEAYLDIKNPYIIDAKGKAWTGIIADEYKEGLQNKNYDGVIVKNVIDAANNEKLLGNVYAVKDPSQIKIIKEQPPAQEVEQLRAKEQAELKAAIPNADQYLTDGKVDEKKLTDPKDKKAFKKIYDKYNEIISPLLLEVALEDVNKARSVKYWMEPEFGAETNKYPQTGKPNSFIKREQSGTIMGGGKWASDDIVAYDKNGKIVGSISIEKEGEEKGAFKIVVREDAKRQGWGKKILDEAEKQGIDIVGNIKKNSFTQNGRNLVRNWLEGKKEAKAQEAPAKAEPKLKPRVETRIKFAKAIELFNDISATKGGAKKSRLASDRRRLMEQNPSIKYIDDNWRKISKQLEDKGLLKKEGNCP